MSSIRLARSAAEIDRCYPVMRQLRPHLDRHAFAERIARQQSAGYRLAYCEDGDGTVVAVAGFRVSENLAWGKFLYVDDLVTDATRRSGGHGAGLLAWLRRTAVDAGCAELHLDSGVQRFAAHRFYTRHRMEITSHHFRLELTEVVS